MDINNLFEELENLKKEVWYLIKKTIPKLEELINGSSSKELEEIKNQLQNALLDIENLKSQLNSIDGKIDTTNENVSTLQNNFQTLSNTINNLSQSLTTLQQTVSTNSSNISNLTNSVNTNSSDIDSLNNSVSEMALNMQNLSNSVSSNTSKLNNLETTVSSNSSKIQQNETSISTLQSKITTIENVNNEQETKISSLQSSVSSIESTNSQQNESISSLADSISSLTSSISSLQTEIENAKKENCEIIYDMYSEDASINYGFTSGAKGGSYFVLDFTKYHSVRIFARLQTANVVQEVKILDRKLGDVTLTGAGGSPSSLYILKIILGIAPLYNRLQVGYYGKYTFSTNGTFTLETGASNDYFYIYRLEGIIK